MILVYDMGLLEKALQYKQNMNNKGEDTLIDRIKGPADTELVDSFDNDETIKVTVSKEDEVKIGDSKLTAGGNIESNISSDDDLFDLPEADNVLPSEKLNSQKISREAQTQVVSPIIQKDNNSRESDIFGAADEPVISKNKLIESGAQSKTLKNKTDDAFPDSNTADETSISSSRFSDIIVLYEIEKDIIKAETREDLFDVILFSIMGQIGVSSTSIMLPAGIGNKWMIAESRGVEIDRRGIEFTSADSVLKKILFNNRIADIENYNKDEFKDEYLKYISIDARILMPMIKDDNALGVIVLGNKITGDDYKDEDFDFIKSIADLSARVLHNLSINEKYIKQIDDLKKNTEIILEAEVLQEKILSFSNIEEIQSEIKKYFLSLGIDSYGIFNRFENDATYKPVIVENEDFLLLKELDFNIKLTSNFSRYIFSLGQVVDINDFKKAEIARDVFSESQINKMSHLRIYPFSIAKKSWGFIALFRIRHSANLEQIDARMTRISKYIFPYINSVRDINFKENKYIDNIEILYKRIDDEIINARSLGIPLTLVLFSIKNYKRYFNLYGFEEVKKLFESFEKIIKSRLADGDFSVRYDRHKILIILPGKDKKFAVPLANSIRNELLSVYQQKEVQLLLTYLTAEYPEDGTNLYSLIDTID